MVAAGATVIAVGTAARSARCAQSDLIENRVEQYFNEDLYGVAVDGQGRTLQIYSNDTQTSWTILVNLPRRGLSCLVATGTTPRGLDRYLDVLVN